VTTVAGVRSSLLPRIPGLAVPELVAAEGAWLVGPDGTRYLDGISGSMTTNLGYSNPDLVEALREAATRLPFVHEARGRAPETEALAEELLALAPESFTKVYFTVSGAEAVEAAIRLAALYQQGRGRASRWRIAATTHSYHGASLGALSATGIPRARRDYERLLVPFARVPSAFCFRCPLGLAYPSSGIACADELAGLLASPAGADVAGFLFEPVIANAAGSVVLPQEYVDRVRAACTDADVLLIADEITTGLGRTGRMFACEHYGLLPDVLCVGKGLGVGYAPISAVLVTDAVADALPPQHNLLGHNFNAHPIAVAVARVALARLREEQLVDRVARLGARLLERLRRLERHGIVAQVRGLGLLVSVELADAESGRPFDPSLHVAARVTEAALEHGLLVLPGSGTVDGVRGDHVTLTPPFVCSEEEIDLVAVRLDRAVEDVAATLVTQEAWA
jgi:adenosylmethionine-8-amino-7-oxononanoate aminotransferase